MKSTKKLFYRSMVLLMLFSTNSCFSMLPENSSNKIFYLFLQNDTKKPLKIRWAKGPLSLDLLQPNKQLKLNSKKPEQLEVRYVGFPDLTFREIPVIETIQKMDYYKKNAIIHLDSGTLGVRIGKIDYNEVDYNTNANSI